MWWDLVVRDTSKTEGRYRTRRVREGGTFSEGRPEKRFRPPRYSCPRTRRNKQDRVSRDSSHSPSVLSIATTTTTTVATVTTTVTPNDTWFVIGYKKCTKP